MSRLTSLNVEEGRGGTISNFVYQQDVYSLYTPPTREIIKSEVITIGFTRKNVRDIEVVEGVGLYCGP